MSAYIRQNKEENETQLIVNGEYQAGWAPFEIPKEIKGKLDNMLAQAVEVGQRLKAEEIRKVLGVRS
jgi:hypothetical protein